MVHVKKFQLDVAKVNIKMMREIVKIVLQDALLVLQLRFAIVAMKTQMNLMDSVYANLHITLLQVPHLAISTYTYLILIGN